jgi:hypothetical protein
MNVKLSLERREREGRVVVQDNGIIYILDSILAIITQIVTL